MYTTGYQYPVLGLGRVEEYPVRELVKVTINLGNYTHTHTHTHTHTCGFATAVTRPAIYCCDLGRKEFWWMQLVAYSIAIDFSYTFCTTCTAKFQYRRL